MIRYRKCKFPNTPAKNRTQLTPLLLLLHAIRCLVSSRKRKAEHGTKGPKKKVSGNPEWIQRSKYKTPRLDFASFSKSPVPRRLIVRESMEKGPSPLRCLGCSVGRVLLTAPAQSLASGIAAVVLAIRSGHIAI